MGWAFFTICARYRQVRSVGTKSSICRCVAVWRPQEDQGDGGQDGLRAGSGRGDHRGRGRPWEVPELKQEGSSKSTLTPRSVVVLQCGVLGQTKVMVDKTGVGPEADAETTEDEEGHEKNLSPPSSSLKQEGSSTSNEVKVPTKSVKKWVQYHNILLSLFFMPFYFLMYE